MGSEVIWLRRTTAICSRSSGRFVAVGTLGNERLVTDLHSSKNLRVFLQRSRTNTHDMKRQARTNERISRGLETAWKACL